MLTRMTSRSSRRTVAAYSDDTIPIEPQPVIRPSSGRIESPRWEFRFPVMVALVHLLIVQATASLASRFGTPNAPSPPYQVLPPVPSGLWEHLVGPMRLWDGLWYRLIAIEGYPKDHMWNAAFWPLYPMAMRGLHRITGFPVDVAGYLIANVCFFVAMILLYQLVRLDFDTPIARRTLWAIALFPTALFFTAVYTESLFLMLSVAAILSARLRRWWLAGLLGALAALTRSHGIFLVIPFAVLWVKQYGFYLRPMIPKGLTVGMPLLGPAIFAVYLQRTQDNWRTFIDVQGAWNRTFAWPWKTFECALDGCSLTVHQYGKDAVYQAHAVDWTWFHQLTSDPSWSLISSNTWRQRVATSDSLELVMTVLFIVLIVIGFKVLPLYQSLYLVPGILIPLFQPSSVHPLMSIPRFGLVLFPLFIVMAIILRKRILYLPAAVISVVLLILLTVQFSTWYWVS